MKRSSSPQPAECPACTAASGISLRWQIAISVLLLVHLCALLTAPLQVAAAGSPAIRPLSLLQPYVNLLYLNHSYFFFAPNPGANHLVRYELEFDDGRKPIVGEFPDRKTEWPRLLYHRHFMLSESLHTAFAWPTFPPEPQPPADDSRRARREFQREHDAWETDHRAWEQRRALYESLHKSIAEHLKQEYGASDVTLIRREHRFLNPWEVSEDRLQLTDKETYRNLPEVPDAETLPWNPDPQR
jgi:hypothetical protein